MSDFADVPKSTSVADTVLAYSVEIAKGATHTYSAEFKYENSTTEDQSDDMGKKLSGTLFIEKGTVKPYNYDETTLCHNNNWLFQGSNQWQRFIGPSASRANLSFGVEANGCAHSGNYVINLGAYSPVMALSKDVLVSGSGTKTDPYVISM